MKLFVRLAAAYFVIIGLISLAAPQAASGNLGHSLSHFDVFMARSLGAALTAIGMINWSISARLSRPMQGLFAADIFVNVSLAIIDIAAVQQRVIGTGSWFGIGMHALLCAGFVYCLFRNYNTQEAKE